MTDSFLIKISGSIKFYSYFSNVTSSLSIGIFGSALTLGLAKNNILTPIIVIPFYIPVLIFSASAIESVSAGLPYDMQLYILIALLFLILPIMPYLLKYTLGLSINN